MAGTRTAPAMTAAMTSRLISLLLIDASGDLYADSLLVPIAATSTLIDAWAVAYAAGTNASLYGILDQQLREGARLASNAVAEYRGTVAEGINLSIRDAATRVTLADRLIAPVAELMVGDSDTVNIEATEFTDWRTALLALKTSYTFRSAQFTGRRERFNNPKSR